MSAAAARPALAPEETALLRQVAAGVVRRRMAVPAMMFLEMSTPMNLLGASALHLASPLWRAVVPASRIDRLAHLLEKRAAIPALIDAIDDAEEARRRGAPLPGEGDDEGAAHPASPADDAGPFPRGMGAAGAPGPSAAAPLPGAPVAPHLPPRTDADPPRPPAPRAPDETSS